MVEVAVTAQTPAVGVNVYVVVPVVAVLAAGNQVPVMTGTLVELVGKTGAVAFWQTLAIAANVGVTGVLTVISNVVVVAHWPTVGVNVYVVVPKTAVLTAGAHVPVIGAASAELVGKTGAVAF